MQPRTIISVLALVTCNNCRKKHRAINTTLMQYRAHKKCCLSNYYRVGLNNDRVSLTEVDQGSPKGVPT